MWFKYGLKARFNRAVRTNLREKPIFLRMRMIF